MIISYAQAAEDVMLHRALHHVHYSEGFYVDVGAYHPTTDSVTKHFYDHGWRGVNIEASRELFGAFISDRPRDVNLHAAVTDQPGEVTFHQVAGQLGTLEDRVAETHSRAGISMESYTVPAVTLTEIFEKHTPRDVHFLKIDVEGHEASALRGMDFRRFRPWVLAIEATEPNRHDLLTHHEWEGIIISAGYQLGCADLPNRYYVANEHRELLPALSVPVDRYMLANVHAEIAELRARM
ncbi:FkbM family methyltransferase [Sphingomonas arantia]|uniref:FkbM family methyltransferase n=1 Tax=Sphingomonas arantia TaxID=1460676 RepID=A0ABW4TUI7_9SPHN